MLTKRTGSGDHCGSFCQDIPYEIRSALGTALVSSKLFEVCVESLVLQRTNLSGHHMPIQ